MFYKITLIGLIFTLYSCQNEAEKKRYNLTNGTEKYWILNEYTDKNGISQKTNKLVLKFAENYDFVEYLNDHMELFTFKDSDDIKPNKWYLKNDSTLNLNYIDYSIIILNEDTLKLKKKIDDCQYLYTPTTSKKFK